jgi:CHASE2 domain-containing sensor protein
MPATGKLVILKLDGDFQQGFRVTLEIGLEDSRPVIEVSGELPPAPELAAALTQWQQDYRRLGVVNRIKPQEIIYDGSLKRLEDCRRSAHQLRDRLLHWLESDSFRIIDRRLRESLSLNESIRVIIRTQNQQLRRLPWSSWDFIERYTNAELALSAPIFEQVKTVETIQPEKQVKILAILGNSSGIEIETDRHLLQSLPDAKVSFLVEPQRQQINDYLWEQPWDILFFAGHSETNGSKGRIYINQQDSLTLDELKYGLRQAIAQGLQLAIFNSCDGLGLAQELEQLQLPQLIVMREPVPDRIAQWFLKYFLAAFSQGDSLYQAARQARERLQGLENDFPCASWLPVICQNPTAIPPTWFSLSGQLSDSPSGALPEPLGELAREPSRSSLPAVSSRKTTRPLQSWRILWKILITSALVTSLIVGVRSLGVLQPSELRAFDHLMQLRPAETIDDRIVIIGINEADIQYQDDMGMERRGSLSDQALAQLLQKLAPHQPRVIASDIFHDFEFTPNLAADLQQQNQLIFICQIGQNQDNAPDIAPPPQIPVSRLGFSNSIRDRDQITRRQFLGMTPSDQCPTDYSLSLRVATHYLEQLGLPPVQRSPKGEAYIGDLLLPKLTPDAGGYQLTSTQTNGYQILLNYRHADFTQVALRDVLNGSLDSQLSNLFENRIALIGVTTPSIDAHPVPMRDQFGQREIPGIVLHAHMISQLLSAVLDHRPLLWWLPQWAEAIWIGSWAMIGSAIVWGWYTCNLFRRYLSIQWIKALPSSWVSLSLASVSTITLLYGLAFTFLLFGGWIPLVPAALAFIATGGCVAYMLDR